ncbi:IS66-like element accessory protein TnpA [Microbulbifer harenosus]|uniref:IS66 family insertion sequence element accessory protein TnpB n=1 Tax=Microbulbifer harenosus TaxID=2576840 RepID=A0ABY2UHE0_9GAMM|nr:transposase [Microbulbifer harenosus]TLM74470.1 IS66 family insertion sequence element accessory protein TnpB [Microbulbifer harenosus]
MSDIIPVKTPVKRRRHSPELKAKILRACQAPGTSVTSVALQHGINANLIHKWRREAEGNQKPADQKFVPVSIPAPRGSTDDVVFELPDIKVRWPLAQIDRAIPWLRALQA